MQLIWIQQWTTLPVIIEDSDMGERDPSGNRLLLGQPGDESSTQQKPGESEGYSGSCQSYLGPSSYRLTVSNPIEFESDFIPATARRGTTPYELQLQGIAQQHQSPHGQPFGMQGQFSSTAAVGQLPSGGPFAMSGLIGALSDQQQTKDAQIPTAGLHRLQTVPANVPFGYGSQQISPFAAPTPTNPSAYGTYSQQYASPFQQAATATQAYAQAPPGQQAHSGGPSPNQPYYSGQQYFPPQQQQAYVYYPGQYGPQGGQQQPVQPHPGPYPSSYHRPSGYPYGQGTLSHLDPDTGNIAGRFPLHSGLGSGSAPPYGYHPGGSFPRPGMVPGNVSGNGLDL